MNENQKTLESLEIVKQALEYLKKNKNDFLNKYLNGFEKQDANGLDNIDSMTPFEFENYIKEIFKQKGYNSRLT
jgi:HJR/Mrr/RecB family endonuclease